MVLLFYHDLDLSLAEAAPDIFEECFMKEGRAVILVASGEGIYERTLCAHLHLGIYY